MTNFVVFPHSVKIHSYSLPKNWSRIGPCSARSTKIQDGRSWQRTNQPPFSARSVATTRPILNEQTSKQRASLQSDLVPLGSDWNRNARNFEKRAPTTSPPWRGRRPIPRNDRRRLERKAQSRDGKSPGWRVSRQSQIWTNRERTLPSRSARIGEARESSRARRSSTQLHGTRGDRANVRRGKNPSWPGSPR